MIILELKTKIEFEVMEVTQSIQLPQVTKELISNKLLKLIQEKFLIIVILDFYFLF